MDADRAVHAVSLFNNVHDSSTAHFSGSAVARCLNHCSCSGYIWLYLGSTHCFFEIVHSRPRKASEAASSSSSSATQGTAPTSSACSTTSQGTATAVSSGTPNHTTSPPRWAPGATTTAPPQPTKKARKRTLAFKTPSPLLKNSSKVSPSAAPTVRPELLAKWLLEFPSLRFGECPYR